MGSHFFLQDIFLTEESNCLGKRILYQRTTSKAVTCVEGFLFMRCFHSMVHRWFSGRFLACHTGGLGSGSFPSPCSYSIPSGFLPAVQESLVRFLGLEDPLQKGMAAHSSILAWRILWTEEPGGLLSIGSHKSQTRPKRLSMHAYIGEGNGNPLQYSCLENSVDRGAWWNRRVRHNRVTNFHFHF